MSQDYGKNWEANRVYDLFISIQLIQSFSSMLQERKDKLEKSAIKLKYDMNAERIYIIIFFTYSVVLLKNITRVLLNISQITYNINVKSPNQTMQIELL